MTHPDGGVIDACVFHEWPSTAALGPYLPAGWREALVDPSVVVLGSPLYPNFLGSRQRIQSVEAIDEAVGTDRGRIVLSYDSGILSTANPNYFVARAIAEAANRWTEEEWLTRDERLFGLIAAVCASPEEAAAEVRRSGANPRMVGVLLGAAALGSPLGHEVYHPIFEAAAEMDLPLVLQAGVDATEHAVPSPIGGGLPATSGEYRAMAWHTQMAHVTSLIMLGTLDKFPNLRVLLLGAGALWLPGHFWRLDHRFSVTRGDGRWLARRPIEYYDRFFVSTYRLDRPPQTERLAKVLSAIPDIQHRLLYASGLPDDDAQDVAAALEGIPPEWRDGVLSESALRFFRWPGGVDSTTASAGGEAAAVGPLAATQFE